jgi:iron complex transport system substrate-binding protein
VNRRRFLTALPVALVALGCKGKKPAEQPGPLRIVSLAPAITETLYALGAGPSVVGVSDFCESPPEARTRPRLGTSITPNYEAIARLKPTLIVSERNAASRSRELEALATTRLLPWLTLREIAAGVRELGAITSRQQRAFAIAGELEAKLGVPEPRAGPRVLLVLGEGQGDEIWFIRKNSLHGSVLSAAGARNAVTEDVLGPPSLSNERLLELDPDAIVVLLLPGGAGAAEAAVRRFQRFTTLTAVKNQRVGFVEHAAAYTHGPSVLGLVDRLHGELVRLGALK